MGFSQLLEQIITDLSATKVEASLMLGAVLLLSIGLIKKSKVLLIGIFAATIIVAFYFNATLVSDQFILTKSLYLSTNSLGFSALFLFAGLLVILFKQDENHSLEYYFLLLAFLVGAIFMMKVNNLLIFYLSIELLSFCSYLLSGFSFTKKSFEASLKYLLVGAASSAITLVGIGIIYGSTLEIYFNEWEFIQFNDLITQVGFLLFIVGVLFKASIYPLHLWVPAVYQSAPVGIVALLSTVPKIAVLVLLNRLLSILAFSINSPVISLLLIFGILTILVGTFGALNQKNVRRMISFGSLSNSGFLFVLALFNSSLFQEAFWWFSSVYIMMNYAVFYLIEQEEVKGNYFIWDYKASKNYLIPVLFTIVLVSLIGLPPLAGFTAKLLAFTALYNLYQLNGSVLVMAYLLVAVFATVISLYYYLRVPYQYFLINSINKTYNGFSNSSKIVATLFTFVLLLLFFVPELITHIKHWFNP